jgi:signal transduction histidine kinase
MSGPVKSVQNDGHDWLFRELNQLAEQPESSLSSLCMSICEVVAKQPGLVLSAVLIKPKDRDQLSLVGYKATRPLRLIHPLHLKLDRDWWTDQQDGRLVLSGDLEAEATAKYLDWTMSQLKHNDQLLGIESVYVVKLKSRGHNIGVLAVGLKDKVDLNHPAIEAITAVKGVIATMVSGLISEQASHSSDRKLKLYTEKLSKLDNAKDDFISMASHQLRTPLTSVKGYISMILEGDAGQVNQEQKTMLAQALASCQTMVYTISDLLNVSRLNTGKFVMELAPVNLDFVIKDEVDQLQEISKSRGIEISYVGNPDIPELTLDETKVRQVIMNFIDNALYYTKDGGQIKIILEDKPSSIELRIKDSGMGVPRSEQRHLFTKFYRATNARQARPDGTGLGLYMAKKIVVSLGGAIIFDSVEGKGSTFGFIFPKK